MQVLVTLLHVSSLQTCSCNQSFAWKLPKKKISTCLCLWLYRYYLAWLLANSPPSPFLLRVKSLVSGTESDFQLRRVSAPLCSSQVPSGSGALDQVELGCSSTATAFPHIQVQAGVLLVAYGPADSWEGGWDPGSATSQTKDSSGIGRRKIATSR